MIFRYMNYGALGHGSCVVSNVDSFSMGRPMWRTHWRAVAGSNWTRRWTSIDNVCTCCWAASWTRFRWRRRSKVASYICSIRSCVASHVDCFSTWTCCWRNRLNTSWSSAFGLTRCGHCCGARFSWQRSGVASHVCTIGSPVTFNLDSSISTPICTSRSRPITAVHLSQPSVARQANWT